MTLPSSSEAAQFDRDGAAVRSRWLDGTLSDAATAGLWEQLRRGLDQGASATLRDVGREVPADSDECLAPTTRIGIRGDTEPPTFHHRSLTSFTHPSVPDSVHWIEAGSVAIPCRIRLTGSPILVVTFHGVLQRAKYQLPRFEWLNSLRPLGHNVVSFGDPTMDLVPSLEGGWWLGTALTDLMPILAALVSQIREGIGADHLIFAGSSMGGYGALQLGGYFSDATVVAFNPQTDVRRYHAKRVTRAAMSAVFGSDGEPDPVRTNVFERYSVTGISPSRIRYVTNTGDRHHIEDHFHPFASSIAANTLTTLDRSLRDDGDGHVKVPADVFVSTINEEVAHLGRR